MQMLSYSEGVPSEQTKHTTQDFFNTLYWLEEKAHLRDNGERK